MQGFIKRNEAVEAVKMGILSKRDFIPGCRPVNNTSDGAVQMFECHVKERLPNGQLIEIDSPVMVAREKATNKVFIMDMGGASERQLNKLKQNLKKNML